MLLDDTGSYLQDGGIGLIGIDLYLGFCPKEAPDDCVTLYEYKGMLPVWTFSNGIGVVIERPRLQAVSRSGSYKTARRKAHDVWLLFAGMGDRTLGVTRYLNIHAIESPFTLQQKDHSDRFLIACNYQVNKQVSTF